MSLFSTARSIYVALEDDEKAISAIRDERKALALSLATDPNGATQITSSTVNGQMFTAMQGLKAMDRLKILSLVCGMAKAGNAIPSQTTAIF